MPDPYAHYAEYGPVGVACALEAAYECAGVKGDRATLLGLMQGLRKKQGKGWIFPQEEGC